ncbi:hypothetical protein GW916_06285 [bacterium]|nr:hypothetical protein [bacterium]
MNLEKLVLWAIGVVMAFALSGHLSDLQMWVWKAQARVMYESRASNWGSPRFFGR